MSRFENIQVGDTAELKHLITQQDVEKFVDLTGDDNKLHTDREFAETTAFKKPVAHGMLGASFISTLIGTKLPGDGALWFAQNLEFLLPVRVGDELTVTARVLSKSERDKVIELQTDIFNGQKQKVTAGTAKVRIIETEVPKGLEAGAPRPKVALIIGGTGGIGRATCLQLAKDGFDIAIHCHSNREGAKRIEEAIGSSGRRCMVVQGDITNDYDVEGMVAGVVRKLGAITVLVHCASAKIASTKFSSLAWTDIENHIAINVQGAFNLAKHIAPIMEKQNYGKIIQLTSQATETVNPGWLHYITAKTALNGFSKALAIDLAPKGIRVNLVSPGMTDTELIADVPEKVRLLTAARTPLRRLATPEDVAGAISFLASDRSDFLTGETVRVNGGQVML